MKPAAVLAHTGLLLPPAGAAILAGLAAPVTATDWARAGVILAAAIVTGEIVRRMHTVRRDDPDPRTALAMTSVWSVAAAVAVHLAVGMALVLVVCAYRQVRGNHPVALETTTIAWAQVAAHFAASSGAWITPGPRDDTAGVLALAGAVVAHLAIVVLGHAARERRASLGRLTNLGLEAALLSVGAIAGVLVTGASIVVLVAIPVVVALYNAAIAQQLEGDVLVDQKTGLVNAAAWQARAEEIVAGAVDGRREIGVLMLDLDRFKRLNDTYGHRAGDDVLAAVGGCLRSQLRPADVGGRFGGEEFTVLLPDTNVVETMAIAERIRAAIAKLRVPTVAKDGGEVVIGEVTVSIGAATYPHHGATVEDCLRVADNYVYQAKHAGRNVVAGIDTENIKSMRT